PEPYPYIPTSYFLPAIKAKEADRAAAEHPARTRHSSSSFLKLPLPRSLRLPAGGGLPCILQFSNRTTLVRYRTQQFSFSGVKKQQ
ncbi:MAG: hypothetical protein Q8J86_06090, partial [Desulfurivibrionaceae bacterium]|nr:hypothetical protein [Desulfurivibrionaceae bacterium]